MPKLMLNMVKSYSCVFIVIYVKVLTIAVLSILVTAPLGATVIGLTGPKLLQHSREHFVFTFPHSTGCYLSSTYAILFRNATITAPD